jgi:ribosome-binding factor A
MPSYRPERVAEMIHRELAERLRSEVKDPRVEPISITAIAVSKDLSRATIAYTPLGGGRPSEDLVEGLAHASRQLRGPIGRALRLRHAPELAFEFDEHIDEAFRVSSLIERLAAERREREGEVAPAAEVGADGSVDTEGGEE